MDKVGDIAEKFTFIIGFGSLVLYSLYDLTTRMILRALHKRDEKLKEQKKNGPNREQRRRMARHNKGQHNKGQHNKGQ